MSDNGVLSALRRMGFPKDEMTGHGFRAMARTLVAERLGFDDVVIEAQLAHAVRDALGRAYNRTQYVEKRREMMQAWADYLDTLRTDTAAATQAGRPARPSHKVTARAKARASVSAPAKARVASEKRSGGLRTTRP